MDKKAGGLMAKRETGKSQAKTVERKSRMRRERYEVSLEPDARFGLTAACY